MYMLHIMSKTNLNDGYTCPAIYIKLDTFICRLVAVDNYNYSYQGNINTAICTCMFLHLIICV